MVLLGLRVPHGKSDNCLCSKNLQFPMEDKSFGGVNDQFVRWLCSESLAGSETNHLRLAASHPMN